MTKQRFWVLVAAAWVVSVAGIITMIARYPVNPPGWAMTIVFVLIWPVASGVLWGIYCGIVNFDRWCDGLARWYQALPDRKTNR